jgi:hypothetical protein
MNMRILTDTPFLALRGDIWLDSAVVASCTLHTLCQLPATHQSDTLQLIVDVPDPILQLRLTTCLTITQAALVILSPSAPTITATTCRDGTVYTLPTRTPAFAHIARRRPLPPREQQRRMHILAHPHLAAVIALAQTTASVHPTQVASLLALTVADATHLLKHWNPVFVPAPDHKTFIYDYVAQLAITLYEHEATQIDTPLDPRQHLPEVVRRYSNHLGKINQLPVKLSERTIVLSYLAQQLPTTPMSEPQINAAILQHVAFDDYATARRDMVDLGLVTRTASGSLYQRINDAPADRPTSAQTT